jgi:hypothetical protein
MSNEHEMDETNELPEDQINPAQLALDEIKADIDNYDFGRAVQLMSVMEKVSTTGVMNAPIAGLAGLALNEMNEEAKALRAEYQTRFAEATAEREQLIAERQRREAEEQDEANLVRAVPERRVIPAGNYDPTPGQPQRDPKQVERTRGAGADALQDKTAPPDDKSTNALNLAGETPRRL